MNRIPPRILLVLALLGPLFMTFHGILPDRGDPCPAHIAAEFLEETHGQGDDTACHDAHGIFHASFVLPDCHFLFSWERSTETIPFTPASPGTPPADSIFHPPIFPPFA